MQFDKSFLIAFFIGTTFFLNNNADAAFVKKLPFPRTLSQIEKSRERYKPLDRFLERAQTPEGELTVESLNAFVKSYQEKDPQGYFSEEAEFLLRRGQGINAKQDTIVFFKARIENRKGLTGFEFLDGAIETYNQAIAGNPELSKILPEALVLGELAEGQKWWTGKRLVSILEEARSFDPNLDSVTIRKKLTEYIATHLESWGVEKSTIVDRIKGYFKAKKDDKINAFERLLGKATLEENQHAWYGDNLEQPSEASLIGQYIATTGAQIAMRTFPKYYQRMSPGLPAEKYNEQSVPRLVVQVSAESFPEFKRLFLSRIDWTALPAHGAMLHEGKLYGVFHGEYRKPDARNIIPVILASSTEGERIGSFFLWKDKGIRPQGWPEAVGYPHLDKTQGRYGIKDEKDAEKCDFGCTSWNGEIQFGEERVDSRRIAFADHNRTKERWAVDAAYDPLQTKEDHAFLLKSPGHASLPRVLGLEKAKEGGLFQSTGGHQTQITGRAPVARAPVVFIFVNDHKAPVDEKIPGYNEAPW